MNRIFGLGVVAAVVSVGLPADWPQWRGPDRNGVSQETGLPLKWTPQDNIVWKAPMPDRSGSTPIIWGDRLFVSVAEGESLHLWCFDKNSGRILWKRPLGRGNQKVNKANLSSPSPVTDGRMVWVMTGTGVLRAFDFDGNEQWRRDLQKEYGSFGQKWGYSSSPLLWDDSLYVQVLHGMLTDDPSYLLRIDKNTGKNIWRTERPTDALFESPDAYSTPTAVDFNGRKEIVISGGDYVTGHALEDGRELWRASGINPNKGKTYRIVGTPLFVADLIIAPSKRRPLLAFRAGGEGNITESHLVYRKEYSPDVPSPLSDGRYLYLITDKGIAYCLNLADGQEIYRERIHPAIYSASPILAGGRIYATSEDGVTTVLAAGSEFKVLAENQLEGFTLSSPAVSQGRIYMRTQSFLYCIGE